MPHKPRIVVVGAGFAGLAAIDALAGADVEVLLVDQNVYSMFQPLLYQVATAGLTGSDVAYPLWTAARKSGAAFRKGQVSRVLPEECQVLLADGSALGYDYLLLATGVGAAFFGVPGAAETCLSLYTRRDAIILRDAIMAELERHSAEGQRDEDFAITVIGGGATGVELAGTLAELRNIALRASFPEINRERLHVRLIEGGPFLLAPFAPKLRDYALRELCDRGVEVHLNTMIKQVRPDSVILADGAAGETELASAITVWAAGVSAPEWISALGLPTGKGGRIRTEPDLRVTGQDRIFAVGDIALPDGEPIPQLAQPAMQMGKHAAAQMRALLAGRPTAAFRYRDKGIMATIGHRSAVVELPHRIRVRGTLAWLAWLGLHLFTLLGGRNRLSALVNLSWRYLTWSRGGGVIIGDDRLPVDEPASHRAG